MPAIFFQNNFHTSLTVLFSDYPSIILLYLFETNDNIMYLGRLDVFISEKAYVLGSLCSFQLVNTDCYTS